MGCDRSSLGLYSKNSKQAEIGNIVDNALDLIEKESLRGVLPKNYSRPELDKRILGEIIDLFTNINVEEIST